MSYSPDGLYDLLPLIYRQRDAEQGYPLRALLRVIAEQVDVVGDDIAQLYENWFIETSQDWVVPYIGDLIGYQPVHEAGEPGDVSTPQGQQRNKILIPRREVANTIRYRRRKGTLAVLELLAESVAGWPARAVEFYRLLSWTQAINHLRLYRGRTVNLRRGDALDRLDGPFDSIAHSVDVRRIVSHRTVGRYNIPSVGVFVWRLRSYPVTQTPAYCLEEVGPQCYTFSVLSNDTPLYVRPGSGEPAETSDDDDWEIADELDVPVPIRRRAFEQRKTNYYGDGKSLQIWVGDPARPGVSEIVRQPIPPEQIVVADLTGWQYRPHPDQVAVDPKLGRIAFSPRHLPQRGVWVSYHYGFSADVGGGEYDRPIVQLSLRAVSLFRTADLKDAAGLAAKLRDKPDPVSQYIRAQCSPETGQLLDAYDGSTPPPDALVKAMIVELNQLLEDDGLFDPQRFAGVNLSQEIVQLLAQNPQGQLLIRLNRLLLEAAYPDQIARSYGFYEVGDGQTFQRIVQALQQWQADSPRHAVIEITDSGAYVEQINIELGAGQSLQLRAANRKRPVIRLLDWQTDLPDSLSVKGESGSEFALDGLLVTGRSVQIEGDVRPTIRHSTLVPGWGLHNDCEPKRPAEPSLELFNVSARVTIEHSIVGSIQVNEDEVKTEPVPIQISDSILDATSDEREAIGAPGALVAHAQLTIARCTVFGQVQVHAIELAENSIFTGLIKVARSQVGCMRFCSYVKPGSRTPRRYDCQPDLVEQAIEDSMRRAAPSQAQLDAAKQIERDRVRPQFNSVRYGTPTYCQLAQACADEIKRGADDESELGVFHDLYQPQREANLRTRLDEFTPAGMEAGVIFAT